MIFMKPAEGTAEMSTVFRATTEAASSNLDLVERVAKRIYDHLAPATAFDYCPNISQTRWGDAARAVIAIVKADH